MEEPAQRTDQGCVVGIDDRWPGDDENVPAGLERGRHHPERLSKPTPDPVANDRAADAPADGDAEALVRAVAIRNILTRGLRRERIQDEVPARHRFAMPVYAIELGAARKTSALLTHSHVLRV